MILFKKSTTNLLEVRIKRKK